MTQKNNSLVDQLPFWHLEEDGLMVYQDGSLGCGFRLEGADISCASHDEINRLATHLENVINLADEGLTLQFFYKLSPKTGGVIDEHKRFSKAAPLKYTPFFQSRCRFLESIEDEGGFFVPRIHLFVRGMPHQWSQRNFWESGKKFVKIAWGEFVTHKSKFLRSKKKVESALADAGLAPKSIDAKEWFELLFGFFNLSREEQLPPPELRLSDSGFPQPFSSQFLLTDMVVYPDCVQLGKYRFKSITLKNLPESSHASMVNDFLRNLPFHCIVSQNVVICDQKRELDKLHLRRRLTHSLARGARNMEDLESESQLQHTEELIRELLEGSEKIVLMDFTVVVWGEDSEELDHRCNLVLRSFQNMERAEGMVETLPSMDVFMSAAPGFVRGMRHKKVKSSNCACFMPVYSFWKGNPRPVCLFENREGGLVKFDPFPEELPSWNSLIFAASGSGKSFAVLQMALQFYGQHPTPQIVWIDNGSSSERLLDPSILDGQFVDLNLKSDICLNMFDLPAGTIRPGPDKIKLILAVLEQILKEDNRKGLPKRSKALLEEAIYGVYQAKSPETPVLSDLRAALAKHPDDEMRVYARILFPWTGERAYGRLLDGKTNINLDKDLMTVEIKGLDAYPDLQNVMLLNFTEFIKSKAAEDTKRPTLLIVDEAWKLLETPAGRSFTIEAYRTFRKFGAGIWCISQNYKDFLVDEDIANALFPNTSSVMVLKQSNIDWRDFQKRLQLDEVELETAKGLNLVKGEYSEIFLMQNGKKSVLRIQADPLAYYIATSDPADKRLIEQMEKENPDASKLEILRMLTKTNGGE